MEATLTLSSRHPRDRRDQIEARSHRFDARDVGQALCERQNQMHVLTVLRAAEQLAGETGIRCAGDRLDEPRAQVLTRTAGLDAHAGPQRRGATRTGGDVRRREASITRRAQPPMERHRVRVAREAAGSDENVETGTNEERTAREMGHPS